LGTNIVQEAKERGHKVVIIDNIARPQVNRNWNWVHRTYPEVKLYRLGIWNKWGIFNLLKMFKPEVIIHLAGQVGVPSAVKDPEFDFKTNAVGTFNMCEIARKLNCGLIYSSTCKVYGDLLNSVPVQEVDGHYDYKGPLYKKGIPEDFPFHAKEHGIYGTSKLVGDLYVTDYNKIYGINTVVNRMSCLYGKWQYGSTSQGWLNHFLWSKAKNKPITIDGDGKQFRDMLYGTDCAKCYMDQTEMIEDIAGEVFNLGGGWDNSLSVLEGAKMSKAHYEFGTERISDQKVIYMDTTRLRKLIGWRPKVDLKRGVKLMRDWIYEQS